MRKIKLYIAMSLNGKIAGPDGELKWLESMAPPKEGDYGFAEFVNSIDATIQGYSTYKLIADRGFEVPTKDKTNYVITRKQNLDKVKYIDFVTENHLTFIEDLKQQEGKDIWLIGGGQVNTMLLNAGLIDEMVVFIMPIILSKGIQLFEFVPVEKKIDLIDSKTWSTGAVELRYRIAY